MLKILYIFNNTLLFYKVSKQNLIIFLCYNHIAFKPNNPITINPIIIDIIE
jgi:hypothetical protein